MKMSKRKAKFSKRVVCWLLAAVALFTAAVLIIFLLTGMEPSRLIGSLFACAGGEAGVLGVLKHSDNRYTVEKNEPMG